MKATIVLASIVSFVTSLLVLSFEGNTYSTYTQTSFGGSTIELTKKDLKDIQSSESAKSEESIANLLKRIGRVTEIDGGIWFNPSISKPQCDDTSRGLLWYDYGEDADIIIVCRKISNKDYQWTQL